MRGVPRAGLGGLTALLALFALLAGGPEPAAAQLVSNLNQADGAAASLTPQSPPRYTRYAQSFTTGSNVRGYKLHSVDIEFSGISNPTTMTRLKVTIRENSAAGGGIAPAQHHVKDKVTLLKNPNRYSFQPFSTDRLVNFRAVVNAADRENTGDKYKAKPIDLKPNTTYWVVVNAAQRLAGAANLRTTNGDGEAGETGFTIGDTARRLSAFSFTQSGEAATNWHPMEGGASLKLRLNGRAVPPPQPTDPPLVSNMGQGASAHHIGLHRDHAQRFTTGANGAGYTLNSVDVRFARLENPTVLSHLTLTIRSDSGGDPGAEVGTLTNPTSVKPFDLDEALNFRAPAGGIDLAASTAYWVVLDVGELVTGMNAVRMTVSDSEDGGHTQAGFTIADASRDRPRDSSSWQNNSASKMLSINGWGKATANADGSFTVPADWPLKPQGVSAGGAFRLLFVTEGAWDAVASDIAVYDGRVQGAVYGSDLSAIKPYTEHFKVVGSTSAVNIRNHLGMRDTSETPFRWRSGIAIWWLDDPDTGADTLVDLGSRGFRSNPDFGRLVAHDYYDFCNLDSASDGTQNFWRNDEREDFRNEHGEEPTATRRVFTGSDNNCTAEGSGRTLGQSGARVAVGGRRNGRGKGGKDDPPLGPLRFTLTGEPKTQARPLYGISPVFVVGASALPDVLDPPNGESRAGLVFRVCAAGGCDPNSDVGWSAPHFGPPNLTVPENAGPVMLQYRLYGHPGEPYRFAQVRIREQTGQNVNYGAPGRLMCLPSADHKSMQLGLSTNLWFYVEGRVNKWTKFRDDRLLSGCDHFWNDIPWAERDEWHTITFASAGDADTADQSTLMDVSLMSRQPATSRGYGPAYVTNSYQSGYLFRLTIKEDAPLPTSGNNNRPAARIVAVNDSVTEGSTASFRVHIDAARSSATNVKVLVESHGDNCAVNPLYFNCGQRYRVVRTVAAAANSSTILSIGTVNNNSWRGNAPITATIISEPGDPYRRHPRQGAATIWVLNDTDEPAAGLPRSFGEFNVPEPVPPVITVSADALQVVEGDEVSFTLHADKAPVADTPISLAVDQDYGTVGVGSFEFITFPAGQTSHTWTVTAAGDAEHHPDGTIEVRLFTDEGSWYQLGDPSEVRVVLLDDDRHNDLIATVEGYLAEPGNPDSYYERWQRVLLALGIEVSDFTGTPMTAAEAAGFRAQFPQDDDGVDRWGPVETALDAIPELRITSNGNVWEGADATFTITADPAPSIDLTVSVTVAVAGDYGVEPGERLVTIPPAGSATLALATADDAIDEPDGAATVTLNPSLVASYTLGTAAAATAAIVDDDVPTVAILYSTGGNEGDPARFTIAATPAPHAPLEVDVTVTAEGDYGVTTGRQRVTIPTSGSYELLLPTIDDEVHEPLGYITVTLSAVAGSEYTLGAASRTVGIVDDDTQRLSSEQVALLRDVRGYVAQRGRGEEWVTNWQRVLLALGEDVPGFTGTPMTAAESQVLAAQDPSRWDPVVKVLSELEAQNGAPTQPVDPEVNISAASGGTEGTDATFTLTATPPPTADLAVSVMVAVTGDYGVSPGAQTVTIPSTGSATLTLSTDNDAVDEPDGSITVTLHADTGYTVGTLSSETVAILDDDSPSSALSVKYANLIADVRGYAAETSRGATHVTRWQRVLLALGEEVPGFTGTPMTAAEAQGFADKGWSRWDPVAEALTWIESQATEDTPPPPPTPEINITAASGGTEGGDATFTLSAHPVPTADLDVRVTVAATGDFGVTAGMQTVTIPSSGSATLTVPTTDDAVDEADGSVTVTIDAAAGTEYTVGALASETVAILDDDEPAQQQLTPQVTYASLIADVRGYIAESGRQAVHYERWQRVLVALGEDVPGFTGTPMTAAEAQTYADKGWTRWDPVVDALTELEAHSTDESETQPPVDPEVRISAGAAITEGGTATFTLTASPKPTTPLTVSVSVTARGDYGVTPGVETVSIGTGGTGTLTVSTSGDTTDEPDGSVTATLANGNGYTVSASQGTATVAIADDDATPVVDPPQAVDPEVHITAGAAITEGGDATFTLTASPVPDAALAVSVTIAAAGDFGVTAGAQTVTIPSTGSAPLTLATTDDAVDEADGSVTVTVNGGNGYTVSASQGTATVAIADDDVTPEVSITADSDITEGGAATFTLTATPPPTADLEVRVTVTASGDYGVTPATQTVIIPSTGSAPLTLATTDDAVDEADGSVTATLATGNGYTVSASQGAATVAIADDDVAPEVSISADGDITEGGDAVFTLTATPVPTADLEVSVTVTASGDYGVTPATQTVTIPSTGSASLPITTTDDAVDEADGSVTVTVQGGEGYTVAAGQEAATVAIADDDDPPAGNSGSLTVSIAAATERAQPGEFLRFTITASEAAEQEVTVSYELNALKGSIPGLDYCVLSPDEEPDDDFSCSALELPWDHDHTAGTVTIAEGEEATTLAIWIDWDIWLLSGRELIEVRLTEVEGAKEITEDYALGRVDE